MKKHLFILFVFVPMIQVQAQKEFPRLQIGPVFSLDYNYRTLKLSQNEEDYSFLEDMINNSEHGKISYTTGINLIYDIFPYWGLETGLCFSNKGFTKETSYYTAQGDYSGSGKSFYHLYYVDIPFKLNFYSGTKTNQWRYIATIGVITNIFHHFSLKWNISSDNPQFETPEAHAERSFSRINFSPIIGFGMEYKITDQCFFRALPTFRYSILESMEEYNPSTEYTYNHRSYQAIPFNRTLWNIGLELGISYEI